MEYDIVLAPEAVEDLRMLKANVRTAVRKTLEIHLRQRQAEVASNACGAFAGHNTGCGLAKSGYSMMSPVRRSKYWRS
jgi:hypothetical protein